MSNGTPINNTSNGHLSNLSDGFEAGAQNMMAELSKAEQELMNDPSNPSALAKYQAKLSEYTLFRASQSNIVKAMKDTNAGIIQNLR